MAEQMQKYYASHLRRIPLDDGAEKASCGEVYSVGEVDAALDSKDREIERLRARLNWAANELLACDYGDNHAPGQQIGWLVKRTERRIYGASIDAAIDNELYPPSAADGKESGND